MTLTICGYTPQETATGGTTIRLWFCATHPPTLSWAKMEATGKAISLQCKQYQRVITLTPYIAAEIGIEWKEKYWSQSAEVELLWSFHVLLTSIVQMTQSSQCIYLHATSDALLTSFSGVSENNFCTIPHPVEWPSCTESNLSSLNSINLRFISYTWSLSWGRHTGPVTISFVWKNEMFGESTFLTQKSCQSWLESSNRKTQKGCLWPIRGTSPCKIALGTLTSKKHIASPTYRQGCWCKECFNACWIRLVMIKCWTWMKFISWLR